MIVFLFNIFFFFLGIFLLSMWQLAFMIFYKNAVLMQ